VLIPITDSLDVNQAFCTSVPSSRTVVCSSSLISLNHKNGCHWNMVYASAKCSEKMLLQYLT